jgi:hypothetical protein
MRSLEDAESTIVRTVRGEIGYPLIELEAVNTSWVLVDICLSGDYSLRGD